MHTKPTLVYDQISYSYTERLILHTLSLTIMAGEWFCLLGKSGAGKSTLARIGAGLVTPQSGTVQRLGNNGIGYLAQSPGDIFIGTTIFEEVAFGLRLQGKSHTEVHERVAQALQLVGLSHLSPDMPPTMLSGGQQQLLGLAAVLAPQPSVLILDEPTSMLDPEAQLAVLRVLRTVAQTGTSILHITHRPDEALWAHRVGILYHGRLAGVGQPVDILSDVTLLHAAGAETPELLRFQQALASKDIHLKVSEWSVAGLHAALLAYSSSP